MINIVGKNGPLPSLGFVKTFYGNALQAQKLPSLHGIDRGAELLLAVGNNHQVVTYHADKAFSAYNALVVTESFKQIFYMLFIDLISHPTLILNAVCVLWRFIFS